MTDFLLELSCEEIPARMQAKARADLEKLFTAQMADAGIKAEAITVYSTPRRLTLIANGLPAQTEAVSDEVKGPPEGAPDQAVDGFCRKNGVERDQLELREVKGRQTYFAVIDTPGRATTDVLSEAIPAIIRAFPWPKSQRWGDASISTESLRWVRPLSGIIALFGGEVVDCEIGGIKTGRETMGHRFMGEPKYTSQNTAGAEPVEARPSDKRPSTGSGPTVVTIDGANDYTAKLREAYVIVDHEERQNIVRDGAVKAAKDAGLVLVEDEGLVIENAGLTEWPVPLLGRFDESFLDVPPEVIQLTARVNQKYFVVQDEAGKLANGFVCTANLDASDGGKAIVAGNEKVLAARLSDAKFFWELDQKTTLEDHAKGLERITFHEKLGTVADKVERVAKLARWLCEEGIVGKPLSLEGEGGANAPGEGDETSVAAAPPHPGPLPGGEREQLADLAEQAARLCKADLVTEMVGEFPDLQGLMGGYYAEKEGLPAAVSDAIRDHYKPVGQGDDVPTAPVTVAVSLADKLDTLVSFFLNDMKPTGSKDPFALRRAALSLIALIVRNGLRVPFDELVFKAEEFSSRERFERTSELIDQKWAKAIGLLKLKDAAQPSISRATYQVEIKDAFNELFLKQSGLQAFISDRLKVQQKEAGIRHDLIDAVFALGGEDDLVRLLARVKALQSFMDSDDGANLLAGYKRAANILKQSGDDKNTRHPELVSGSIPQNSPMGQDDGWMLKQVRHDDVVDVERKLFDALSEAEPKAAAAIEAEQFEDAMSALASLRAPIDAFFEGVMVNDEDPAKKAFRLGLLSRFTAAVHAVADFSKIEG